MRIFNIRFFIIILIFLSVDFFSSKIFFKKLDSWNLNLYKKKSWRTASENYHHDLLPNINVIEYWGKNKQILITNSLGFRDFSQRKIKKEMIKKEFY